ncbi:MAG: hypothetical protein ACWA41_11930 [Putridiphycobacter sp.]
MDKSLKIVLIAFAIYAVYSVQILLEKGFWLIPYNYNPLTVFLVAFFILINAHKKPSFKINGIFLIGTIFFCFLSERTLSLFKLYFHSNALNELVQNPFTRLFAVLGFSIAILTILILYTRKVRKDWFIPVTFIFSLISGLLNFQFISIAAFSFFSILFFIRVNKNKDTTVQIKYLPFAYQLLFYTFIENVFFYFS